jgi:hypothetical protein
MLIKSLALRILELRHGTVRIVGFGKTNGESMTRSARDESQYHEYDALLSHLHAVGT